MEDDGGDEDEGVCVDVRWVVGRGILYRMW